MPDQNEQNSEKSDMRVMWVNDRRDCAHHTWADGHEHADSPRLDARNVTPNGKIGKTPTSWSVPLIKPTNAIASCCRARGAGDLPIPPEEGSDISRVWRRAPCSSLEHTDAQTRILSRAAPGRPRPVVAVPFRFGFRMHLTSPAISCMRGIARLCSSVLSRMRAWPCALPADRAADRRHSTRSGRKRIETGCRWRDGDGDRTRQRRCHRRRLVTGLRTGPVPNSHNGDSNFRPKCDCGHRTLFSPSLNPATETSALRPGGAHGTEIRKVIRQGHDEARAGNGHRSSLVDRGPHHGRGC